MRTSEVCNRAADIVQERGWIKGDEGWTSDDRPGAPVCLEGAIMAATGQNHTELMFECPAYRAVETYLGRQPWHWNDTQAGSAERVVEVLRAVAVVEEARERQSEEVLAAT